jgi:hypothetical protein
MVICAFAIGDVKDYCSKRCDCVGLVNLFVERPPRACGEHLQKLLY